MTGPDREPEYRDSGEQDREAQQYACPEQPAAQSPAPCHAGTISVAPVTDRAYYDTKYAEAFMKTPQSNPEGYDKVSLVKIRGTLAGSSVK